jgi:hypothetical protein
MPFVIWRDPQWMQGKQFIPCSDWNEAPFAVEKRGTPWWAWLGLAALAVVILGKKEKERGQA